MIPFETDPVDYLPYVDGSITDAEREAVEQLIRAEIPAEITGIHPQVGELAPLSENRSLLMRHVGQYEQDDPGETVPATFFPGGVSMERYSDFGEGDDFNVNRMYTSLSYGVLRDRNAQIAVDTATERAHAQAMTNEKLKEIALAQKNTISRKRERIDELNSTRQAKQTQFQPVDGYLQQRWKDGVKNMVDMGIERSANS